MSSNSKENSNGKKKYKKNALEYVDFFKEFKKDPKFKTELCTTFTESGFCPYGNKCRFAHGREELFEKPLNHPNYRRSECNAFHSNGYCNYGLRCHFKHHEIQKIENIPRSYYTYLLQIFGDSKNSEVSSTKRLRIFQCITDKDWCHYKVYKQFPEQLSDQFYIKAGKIFKKLTNLFYFNIFPLEGSNKCKSASYDLNFNYNVNNDIIESGPNNSRNLNSKDVVNYFELMNKLTKIIKIDLNSYNELSYNSAIPINYNELDGMRRKVSVNSVNSPNTSSISSADSMTVAMKGKNSAKNTNAYYGKKELSTGH